MSNEITINKEVYLDAAELVAESYTILPRDGGRFSCRQVEQAAYSLEQDACMYRDAYVDLFAPTADEMQFCMDNGLCRPNRWNFWIDNPKDELFRSIAWFGSARINDDTSPIENEYDYNCRMFALLLMAEMID